MTAALRTPRGRAPASTLRSRVAALDWEEIAASLDAHGCAMISSLLLADECKSLAAAYDDDERFRSRIAMARHGFGRGEYKYFTHPLPDPVATLRTALYPPLADIANRWNEALGINVRYPETRQLFMPPRAAGSAAAIETRRAETPPCGQGSSAARPASPRMRARPEPCGEGPPQAVDDGSTCDWGTVLSWEPPSRLVLSWDISADWQYDPELKTEVEVRFIAEGKDGTRVELEHRRLDRYGARRDEMRAIFDKEGDWGRLLQMFAARAAEGPST